MYTSYKLRSLQISFENISCSERELLVSNISFSFKDMTFSKKVLYCFEHMISSFPNTSVPENVKYLLRIYDLFVRTYDLLEEY